MENKPTLQTTIAKEITLEGVGLHTGKNVILTFKPAAANTGYIFKRTDLKGQPTIEADVQYVTNTQRGTNLVKNNVKIQTSEHVLSALVGLQIDNCLIELSASEPPIMDGSSKFFVEALQQAETVELAEERNEYIVKEIIHYRDEESGSEMTLIPWDNYQVTTMVDFGTKVLGTQNASLEHLDEYVEQISSSRTFSFLHELEMLLENGLIQGGDLNNAIVYVDKPLSDATMERLKEAFNKTHISVQPNGILDNLSLHHPMKLPVTSYWT